MQRMKQIGTWAMVIAMGVAGVAAAKEPRELSWNDLVPQSETPQAQIPGSMPHSQLEQLFAEVDSKNPYSVPVVEELNGQYVKVPGFVVPLEIAGEGKVGSFLLVPYFGACMHYPPPPANQIVHVTMAKPSKIESLWAPIWVTGKLTTEFRDSDLGAAGYSMTGDEIDIYE